jgi:signal peptidase I
MKLIKREDVKKKPLPGRMLQLVVGKEDAVSPSSVMTMGFAHYSVESGAMEPHRHAEEIVFVLSARDGWTRYGGTGDQPDELGGAIPLEAGMILHFPEAEWHVFEFDEGGHVDIAFFYSQSDVYSARPSK